MIQFKWRYAIILAILIILCGVRIYYVAGQFPEEETIVWHQGESFSWKDTNVTVKKSKFVSKEELCSRYQDVSEVAEILETYNIEGGKLKLLAVTIEVNDLTYEKFQDILYWRVAFGVTGNGVSYLTDAVHTDITDEPANREVTLFFRCDFESMDEDDVDFILRTQLYPIQEYVELDI